MLVIQELVGNYLTLLMFSVYRSSPLDIFAYFRILGMFSDIKVGSISQIIFAYPTNWTYVGGKVWFTKYAVHDYGNGFGYGLVSIIFFKNIILLGASGVVFMLILLGSFVNFQRENTLNFRFGCSGLPWCGSCQGSFHRKSITQLIHIIGGICGGLFGFKLTAGKEQG